VDHPDVLHVKAGREQPFSHDAMNARRGDPAVARQGDAPGARLVEVLADRLAQLGHEIVGKIAFGHASDVVLAKDSWVHCWCTNLPKPATLVRRKIGVEEEDLDIRAIYLKIARAMLLAVLLALFGLALCGYGVVLASKARRPIDLLGALLAALGLAAVVLGAGRLLSERFFSG
jgi:hypothetical protein